MQKFKQQYIVNEKHKQTGAILPKREYEELLEDHHDFIVVLECRDEPMITLEELKERLRKDGLI